MRRFAAPAGIIALNKPVVVSEETLTEPVIVTDMTPAAKSAIAKAGPAYIVLAGISFSHFLNDTMQSLIASVYPILKDAYALDFAQIGMITLAFQFTASLLQPLVGYYTDKKAQPYSLAIGMASTFFGLLLLSVAHQYLVILIAAAFMIDVKLGVVTALAIIAHEIPQEVGDFLILLHSGYSNKQALFFNLFSSLATLVGGLLGYFALQSVQSWIPTILGLAAASMIYVAVADLIPGLHKRTELKATIQQVVLIALGISSIWVVKWLLD